MAWTDIVIVVLLVLGLVALVARFMKSGFVQSMRQLLFAFGRVPCRAVRYNPGVAALMPAVVREQNETLCCTLWKHHDGLHEATAKTGEIERWPDPSLAK
jgi:hypothetical protein